MATVDIDELIEKTGGCGRYQILLTALVHCMKCITCFSMVFMVFGAATPDWWCADGLDNNFTMTTNMSQYKNCYLHTDNVTRQCTRFVFADNMKTVVSEWSLICEGRDWIPTTITSIQMAGVLVGNLVCGQIADLIGRKPPLFLGLTFLVILNTIAAFSSNWIMFAVIRFLIGVAMGFHLTVQYNIVSEFSQAKWRSWIVSLPSWPLELALFALVSWLIKDWFWLHIATAAIGVPLLFSYWFVPESFRWYVGHDRIDDAKRVIRKMAKFNGKPLPDMDNFDDLQFKAEKEQEIDDRKYTFFDLVRTTHLRKITLLFLIIWISLGLGGYGIQFGLQALTGSLFINVFLLGMVSSPLQFVVIWAQNRFGRKKTATVLLAITVVASLVKAIAERFPDKHSKDTLATVFVLLALIAINAAWSPIQTLTIETYPTVVRNIGYGTQNTMARVGAIIGPQLVFLDTRVSGIMYWICAAISLVSIFLLLPLPETHNADLSDKIIELKVTSDAEGKEIIQDGNETV